MKLDHIGIAVENIEDAVKVYSCCFGFRLKEVLELTNEGMKIAIMVSDDLEMELIEPLREDTPVGKFVKKRGGGIHHICFSVPQFEAAIGHLEEKKLRPIGPPQSGAKGGKVAFFHPRDTMGVLVEICEEKEE